MDIRTGARTVEGVAAVAAVASPARRIPADVWAARREAGEILRVAAIEAEAVVRRAREEAEGIRAGAEEAGRQEGLGSAAADVARASAERAVALEACAPRVLDLAVALAGRILSRTVVPGDDALRAAREALAELAAEGRAVVRANPVDAPSIREAKGALGGHLTIVEDSDLALGEVVVEAGGSRVDGRFAAQLDVLARALREERP